MARYDNQDSVNSNIQTLNLMYSSSLGRMYIKDGSKNASGQWVNGKSAAGMEALRKQAGDVWKIGYSPSLSPEWRRIAKNNKVELVGTLEGQLKGVFVNERKIAAGKTIQEIAIQMLDNNPNNPEQYFLKVPAEASFTSSLLSKLNGLNRDDYIALRIMPIESPDKKDPSKIRVGHFTRVDLFFKDANGEFLLDENQKRSFQTIQQPEFVSTYRKDVEALIRQSDLKGEVASSVRIARTKTLNLELAQVLGQKLASQKGARSGAENSAQNAPANPGSSSQGTQSVPQNADWQSLQAQKAPAQQTPVQQTPAQQAPAQQAPVQQAPVQQAPVQQTPVASINEDYFDFGEDDLEIVSDNDQFELPKP